MSPGALISPSRPSVSRLFSFLFGVRRAVCRPQNVLAHGLKVHPFHLTSTFFFLGFVFFCALKRATFVPRSFTGTCLQMLKTIEKTPRTVSYVDNFRINQMNQNMVRKNGVIPGIPGIRFFVGPMVGFDDHRPSLYKLAAK